MDYRATTTAHFKKAIISTTGDNTYKSARGNMTSTQTNFGNLKPNITSLSYSPRKKPKPLNDRVYEPLDYNNCKRVCLLKKGHFESYLIFSEERNQYFEMRLYPFEERQKSIFFIREAKSANLEHPNLLTCERSVSEYISKVNDREFVFSYTILEFSPYGTFHDLIEEKLLPQDEVLTRTFFCHMIEGLEFLQSKGYAHLNLKLENLILSSDFTLKITGMQYSHHFKDGVIFSKGTRNFRAPEIKNGTCSYAYAADIYSAGIILFVLMSGIMPYNEDKAIKGYDLQKLLLFGGDQFWEAHQEVQNKLIYCDENFKKLFSMMVRYDPGKRATINDIKRTDWYNGPKYSKKDLRIMFKDRVKIPNMFGRKLF